MTRRDDQRLDDIEAACLAIQGHLEHGGIDNGIVFDAVCMRLLEIGESVKQLDPGLRANEGDIPWRDIIRLRDLLAHRYFDTAHAVVQDIVDNDIKPLLQACGDWRHESMVLKPRARSGRLR
jgi:uncharacterized protein with HEPN domain